MDEEKSINKVIANLVLRLKGELNYRNITIENSNITPDQIYLLSIYVQKKFITEKNATKVMRILLDDTSSKEKSIWYLILLNNFNENKQSC